MGLLDGKIAKQVAKAIKQAKLDKPAVLIVVTKGVRTAGHIGEGTNPTETSFACRGFVSTWRRTMLGHTIVQSTDRVVKLLGASIRGGMAPAIGGKITIERVTSRIVDIERDPASAVYACLTRS